MSSKATPPPSSKPTPPASFRERSRSRSRSSSRPAQPDLVERLSNHVPSIIDSAKDTMDIIAQVSGFIPVPGIAVAAGMVKRILIVSEQITANRGEARGLAYRCADLLPILKIGVEKLNPSDVKIYGDRIVMTLEKIERQYTEWADLSPFNQMLHFRSIERTIGGFKGEINQRLQDFQAVATLQSAGWQERESEERRKDFEALMKNITKWSQGKVSTVEDVKNLGVSEDDWTEFMDLLQHRMQTAPKGSKEERLQLQNILLNIILATGNLPPNIQISGMSGEVEKTGEYPTSNGTHYDVYKGKYLGKRDVALKYLRVTQPGRAAKAQYDLKHFVNEAKMWRIVWEKDKGRHIQEFIGIVIDDGPYPYMVSPWWTNGTALQWISRPGNKVDRRALLRGAAEGIDFLHNWEGRGIVHGDIRGVNILINDKEEPLISDFSLSKILENLTGVSLTAASGATEFRWSAPELFKDEQPLLTLKSDVYSFGMTMLELLTANQPYAEYRNAARVLLAITSGTPPKKPVITEDNDADAKRNQKVLDECWELMKECWKFQGSDRPDMGYVARKLAA